MRRRLPTFLIPFIVHTAIAQRPVIHTETAEPLGARRIQTGIGVEYLAKNRAPAPDLPKRQWRAFIANMRFGVADNVDVTLEWLGSLVATYPGGRTAYDWGDLTVATKILIFGDGQTFPRIGIRSAVKLPNTSYLPAKLGNDQTDFFCQAVCSGTMGAFEARLNVGFGIIGNPTSLGIQNDTFTYGAACVASLGTDARAFLEITGTNGYFEDDAKMVARAGASVKWSGVAWNLYGSFRAVGDNRDFATAFDLSENWSIGILLTKDIWW